MINQTRKIKGSLFDDIDKEQLKNYEILKKNINGNVKIEDKIIYQSILYRKNTKPGSCFWKERTYILN